MDRIDRQILAELQVAGRQTITELADRVGLSISPCHRRLRALEQSGTINGYRADVNAAAVNLGFQALVMVTMQAADRGTVDAFEKAVAGVTHVTRADRLFGDPDYLLHVVSADLNAFQRIYDEQIATLPGVLRLTSTIVMKHVVEHRPLPL